ncbi:MAG: hypothetical protein RIK87_27810, partial [Fuerstiella sp.]
PPPGSVPPAICPQADGAFPVRATRLTGLGGAGTVHLNCPKTDGMGQALTESPSPMADTVDAAHTVGRSAARWAPG